MSIVTFYTHEGISFLVVIEERGSPSCRGWYTSLNYTATYSVVLIYNLFLTECILSHAVKKGLPGGFWALHVISASVDGKRPMLCIQCS